jgi:cyclophilin family peptidyl-prolyl cis-trans isomerase
MPLKYAGHMRRSIIPLACRQPQRLTRGSTRSAACATTAAAVLMLPAACGSSSSGTKSLAGSAQTSPSTGASQSTITTQASSTSSIRPAQIGYYNGLTFHRVVPGFVIQGGDPNGNGTGGPNWEVVESPPANLRYTKGVVAMAKAPAAASGASRSQFFIVTRSTLDLPPVYALVGHVVSGEKAVEAISHVPVEAPPEGGPATKPRFRL